MHKKWIVYGSITLFLSVALFFSGCAIPSYMGGTKKIRLALEDPKQIPVQASIASITFATSDFLKWKSLANLKEVEQEKRLSSVSISGLSPQRIRLRRRDMEN